MSQTWGPDISRQVAAQIRELRGDRSGQWLSDRTAELGHRVSRTTISELENGKRSTVALDAVIVLAAALGVPVAHLIYPPDGPLEVEALPGKWMPRPDAIEALAGTAADIQHDRDELDEAMRTIGVAQETMRKLMERNGISVVPSLHVIDESHDGG